MAQTIFLSSCFYLFLFFSPSLIFASNVEVLKKTFEDGVMAYNLGDFQRAIPLFEKSIQMHPLPQAYNYLGLAKRSVGVDLNEVAGLFKKAVELNDNYAEAHENLGKTYYSMGNFIDAEISIKKALELNPKAAGARLSLAWIELLGFSRGAEAIPHFEFAIQFADIPYTYFGLGMAYILDDQKFKALEMITLLREKGEENMALQLERMVMEGGTGGFIKNEAPVFIPNPQPSLLVSDPAGANTNVSNNAYKDMKVRLSPTPVATPSSAPTLPAPSLSGEERLRQLQGQDPYSN